MDVPAQVDVSALTGQLPNVSGFAVEGFRLELLGRCAGCNN